MDIDVTFRHTHEASHTTTQHYIEAQVAQHLTPKLERFHAESLRLHVVVEQLKQAYKLTLNLHLPHKKQLAAHATNERLSSALDTAIDKLARQAEKY